MWFYLCKKIKPLYTTRFEEITKNTVSAVGGKNASLGELSQFLTNTGIETPKGFCLKANAYQKFLEQNGIKNFIEESIQSLNKDFENVFKVSEKIKSKIVQGEIPDEIKTEIKKQILLLDHEQNKTFAIRSSATTEDLPGASFAGLHDTYLYVKGEKVIFESIKKCYASLYNARAIKYRDEKMFSQIQISQSVAIQEMVETNNSSSGVCFTIDPDTGFKNSIVINGIWGLGENLVQGNVDPDEWHVFKSGLRKNKESIIYQKMGLKQYSLTYDSSENNLQNIPNSEEKRKQFCLNPQDIQELAKSALKIEEHFLRPMDIEWAKDSYSKKIYILQARPETVHSEKTKNYIREYRILSKGFPICEGRAVGKGIVSGPARLITNIEEAEKIKKGEILVTEFTSPDWDVILKKVSGIITNKGGRTSHAAIVARELGTLALVGTENATLKIKDGDIITLDNSSGEKGFVYEGKSDFEMKETELKEIKIPDTSAMLILSDPDKAYEYSFLPSRGIGLMRLEFVIQSQIKIHPLALINFNQIEDKSVKEKIIELTASFQDKKEYFIENLKLAVAKTAAAFYPRKVIVRFSDFKSNEYANLIGGKQFEPKEENPMLGFRGAFRYYHKNYKEGFRLECEAIRRAREEMGLHNIAIMIPFCRTPEEADKVIKEMKFNGLKKSENNLLFYMMMEIPSNILRAKEFSKRFDGFSIGSNDLTQLILGIDRDSELVASCGNENDRAVLKMIKKGIRLAKSHGREIGLCGQVASDYPEYISFLIKEGIDSISFNPDTLLPGLKKMVEAEKNSKPVLVA